MTQTIHHRPPRGFAEPPWPDCQIYKVWCGDHCDDRCGVDRQVEGEWGHVVVHHEEQM